MKSVLSQFLLVTAGLLFSSTIIAAEHFTLNPAENGCRVTADGLEFLASLKKPATIPASDDTDDWTELDNRTVPMFLFGKEGSVNTVI